MESAGRVVWHVILGLMVVSVPLGLLVRRRRERRERSISPGLRQLLDPPGMQTGWGPRVCPDHPVYRRTQREIRREMWE
jgi:hypothetical protein